MLAPQSRTSASSMIPHRRRVPSSAVRRSGQVRSALRSAPVAGAARGCWFHSHIRPDRWRSCSRRSRSIRRRGSSAGYARCRRTVCNRHRGWRVVECLSKHKATEDVRRVFLCPGDRVPLPTQCEFRFWRVERMIAPTEFVLRLFLGQIPATLDVIGGRDAKVRRPSVRSSRSVADNLVH